MRRSRPGGPAMPDQDPVVRSLNEEIAQQKAARERTTLRHMGTAAAVIGLGAAAFVVWRRRKAEPVAQRGEPSSAGDH